MAKHSHRRRRASERNRHRRIFQRETRAVAGGPDRLDLALEQLEARQLLAITISEDVIRSNADIVYTHVEIITVDPGVILNAGGGKITLTAPKITIGDGARLLSKGSGAATDRAITLRAANTTSYASWSALDAVRSGPPASTMPACRSART